MSPIGVLKSIVFNAVPIPSKMCTYLISSIFDTDSYLKVQSEIPGNYCFANNIKRSYS